MSKLREAVKEARHTVNVCMLFWRKYTEWRDANPSSDGVFIHVGSPDMAEAVIKRSPRWQLFLEFEKRRMTMEMESDEALAAVHRIAPLLRPAQCNCAACTASKATRSFDA